MIIIKYGGSIINPDGKYSEGAIENLISTIKDRPQESFCLVIGGGKLCRFLQGANKPYLSAALPEEQMGFALDEIGIAVTKINARYLQKRLCEVLGEKICPNLIINPRSVPPEGYSVYLATGAVPGSSTDYDTILLAESFSADRAIKVSDFLVVLDVKALEFDKSKLAEYKSLPEMTWKELRELVGTEWVEGGNYPLDPKAAALGSKLAENAEFSLLIGQYEELKSMIDNKEFTGTRVKN